MDDANRKFVLNDSIKCIICDIEGTTTSISFVKDVLFPYVRANLKKYLEDNFDSQSCRDDINLLIEQAKEDANDDSQFKNQVIPIVEEFNNKQAMIESLIKNIYWQMDLDRKAKALKQLQGNMWRRAYENGSIKGHVYPDVVPAFEKWISKGFKIYIYSSGSVQAQKLLFSYSDYGDLKKYLTDYFDTNIGAKVEKASYEKILSATGRAGNEVLFLTDMINEAGPSKQAGMNVCVVRRPDNPNKETGSFEWITSFDQIV